MSTPPRVPGIDVSHNQGGIVWKNVIASGRKFAFLKATEGATFTDDHFAKYRLAAHSAGLIVGAYHFYRFTADWAQQAHHFCETVGSLTAHELPPVLDIEDRDNVGHDTNANNHRKLLAWLDAVGNRLGKTPIVYCDPDFAKNYLQDPGFARYPLWLAGYSGLPKVPKPWKSITFWQNDEHGTCPGVYGDCDLDYFMGDEESLKALAA